MLSIDLLQPTGLADTKNFLRLAAGRPKAKPPGAALAGAGQKLTMR
jgi:hypothetical protein